MSLGNPKAPTTVNTAIPAAIVPCRWEKNALMRDPNPRVECLVLCGPVARPRNGEFLCIRKPNIVLRCGRKRTPASPGR